MGKEFIIQMTVIISADTLITAKGLSGALSKECLPPPHPLHRKQSQTGLSRPIPSGQAPGPAVFQMLRQELS